jgi:hypothetical protein
MWIRNSGAVFTGALHLKSVAYPGNFSRGGGYARIFFLGGGVNKFS